MTPNERRRHQRLQLNLSVLAKPDAPATASVRAITTDVSTGGLCMEANVAGWRVGQIVDLVLTLPAGEGVHAFESRAKARGTIRRLDTIAAAGDVTRRRIGIEFTQPLALSC